MHLSHDKANHIRVPKSGLRFKHALLVRDWPVWTWALHQLTAKGALRWCYQMGDLCHLPAQYWSRAPWSAPTKCWLAQRYMLLWYPLLLTRMWLQSYCRALMLRAKVRLKGIVIWHGCICFIDLSYCTQNCISNMYTNSQLVYTVHNQE